MKCLICNKNINKRLVWKSLFQDTNLLRCEKCEEKYRVNLNTKIYELDNGVVDIYRLFNKKYRFKSFAYMNELGQLLELIYKRYEINNSDTIILYYDDSIEIINNCKLIDYLFFITDKIVVFTMY